MAFLEVDSETRIQPQVDWWPGVPGNTDEEVESKAEGGGEQSQQGCVFERETASVNRAKFTWKTLATLLSGEGVEIPPHQLPGAQGVSHGESSRNTEGGPRLKPSRQEPRQRNTLVPFPLASDFQTMYPKEAENRLPQSHTWEGGRKG